VSDPSTPAADDNVIPLRRRFQRPHDGDTADTGLERRAIVRAKQGDWDAIHYLYVRYADDVRSYVRSIVKDHHDAEDITQSLFARLITAIGKYEQRDVGFAGWLMRVARNAALDYLRTKRQIPVDEVRLDDAGGHVNSERSHSLREAFDQLPGDQRTVLMMRHVVGLSPSEIAERLRKSEGSIHGLHHRGRRTLQATLRQMDLAPVSRRSSR
jgi:RNA polymerase sigma-70 factor (ECF subfamily)